MERNGETFYNSGLYWRFIWSIQKNNKYPLEKKLKTEFYNVTEDSCSNKIYKIHFHKSQC